MRFLTAILFVDLPVALVVAIVGWTHGYADTLAAILAYREQHTWTLLPTLLMMLLLVRRRRLG